VLLEQCPRAASEHRVERLAAQPQRARAPAAHRHAAGDLAHERLALRAELRCAQRQRQQAYAAVDVIAHPAGGDHAVGRGGRRHAADREAVALMDVRHRQRRPHDARQRGDVL
jgi:hypothetical protein